MKGGSRMKNTDIENACMNMISYSGEGKAKLFKAMDAYDLGNIEESKALFQEAEQYFTKAHEVQFVDLMSKQLAGEEIPFNLLLIHAMDILADCSMQAELFKRKLYK